jgi:hypothetical protein
MHGAERARASAPYPQISEQQIDVRWVGDRIDNIEHAGFKRSRIVVIHEVHVDTVCSKQCEGLGCFDAIYGGNGEVV